MNTSGVRTFGGEQYGSPGGIVRLATWDYYVDIDGNFQLSTDPTASIIGGIVLDVKLAGGDALAVVE